MSKPAKRAEDFGEGCKLLAEAIDADEAAGRMTAGTAAALRLQIETLRTLYGTALS